MENNGCKTYLEFRYKGQVSIQELISNKMPPPYKDMMTFSKGLFPQLLNSKAEQIIFIGDPDGFNPYHIYNQSDFAKFWNKQMAKNDKQAHTLIIVIEIYEKPDIKKTFSGSAPLISYDDTVEHLIESSNGQ